ncbi:syntaxin-18 [Uranotaenia lowii]|uniref:syntaxin-18 n=1 Tax=Uranotaenia lowii TaxID=190385 RepID=UPI002479DA06|nr:syntaxin-18 [Uranotaenia lowii]
MDITSLFKASVKTVRLKLSASAPLEPKPNKSRILGKKPAHEFSEKAKKIRFQITQLKNLLVENRAAYMQFAYHLKSSTQMSDDERDIIDRESENIIRMCTEMLNDFKTECRKAKRTRQMTEFMDLVIEALSNYMNDVHHIANEQRQFRIQRELETYKFLKFYSDKKALPTFPSRLSNGGLSNGTSQAGCIEQSQQNRKRNTWSFENSENEDEFAESLEQSRAKAAAQEEDIVNSSTFLDENEELSAEDIQIFESENVQLYNELKGLSEEVEQIEKNVVEIAQLQEAFTEKISLQKTDIERIANTVVGATENVKDANEQIKQAIQRNAGLRVWVLFFLIVMSLTLLFLDWYND